MKAVTILFAARERKTKAKNRISSSFFLSVNCLKWMTGTGLSVGLSCQKPFLFSEQPKVSRRKEERAEEDEAGDADVGQRKRNLCLCVDQVFSTLL